MMSSLFGEIIPVFFLISFWRVDRSLADEFWFEKYIFTGRKKTLSASAMIQLCAGRLLNRIHYKDWSSFSFQFLKLEKSFYPAQ